MLNTCRVCGYTDAIFFPWGKDGKTPSFEICDCCGYQFGKTDDDEGITFEQYRTRWIAGGMVWDKGRSEPPLNWNPVMQLENLKKL